MEDLWIQRESRPRCSLFSIDWSSKEFLLLQIIMLTELQNLSPARKPRPQIQLRTFHEREYGLTLHIEEV